MKNLIFILSAMLMIGCSSQATIAQNNYGYNNYQVNQSYSYDLSDYLDLEAVASIFAASRNVSDFENRLNDYRNQVSNLDLNNDGYVDYLRLIKFYDRDAQVILIQAVLGRDYFQDVATIVVGSDRYNREYVQIIGDPYLYGDDYILEPTFYKRPSIVRWLWSNANYQYVSRYNWGYYPSYYRLRYTLPMNNYFNHLHVIVNVNHRYYYTNQWRYAPSYDRYDQYRRNDYWRQHRDNQFNQRNRSFKNSGNFQHNQYRKEPSIKDRVERDVRQSESDRRSSNSAIPSRDNTPTNDNRITTPSRDNRATPETPTRNVVPQRDQRENTPSRNSQVVVPQRDAKVSPPSRDNTRVAPQSDSRPAVQQEVRSTPSRTSTAAPKKESTEKETETPARTRNTNNRNSSSGRR